MDNLPKNNFALVKGEIVCSSTEISFDETGYFTKIIIDYLQEAEQLKPFYQHPASFAGIEAAINTRKSVNTDRETLVKVLEEQYAPLAVSAAVRNNISSLANANTFTITTAHQPNIFTGYLYFIYKILHTIKLASALNEKFPGNHFVPVFYMGSEDADLDELGKIFLDGEKITWDTDQKGAVGRMRTKGLEKIIERVEGELSILPFGKQLTDLLKKAYQPSLNIQSATLQLVNALFADYGLVILIPDSPLLKKLMLPVFEDDLLNQTASGIVQESIEGLSKHYKVQANPREINLFYLKDNIRERIVKVGEEWKVIGTAISFTKEEIRLELQHHPERFSPNVILRGVFQETILPNLVFIGGGGELAYWLELKALFHHYQKPFPVLMLRNSFLIIQGKWREKMEKLGLKVADILKEEHQLAQSLVKKASPLQLELVKEINEIQLVYQRIKTLTGKIDKSLDQHVDALRTRVTKDLETLEKKMLRAEKKKFESQLRQLKGLKAGLFPTGNLQERIDNFMPFYARYGQQFITMLYQQSPAISKSFIVLTEKS